MSSSTSPLPQDDHYVEAIRSSCQDVASSVGITPNLVAIDDFLRTLDRSTFERLRTQHGLSFPLRFPTPTAEVNFLAILALLNAFSGYRTAFHKATGLGAYQNIVRLMIGLYISGSAEGTEDRLVGSPALTAKGMAMLAEAKVVELLGVNVHEERQHESLPGVTVGIKGGEMNDAVQMIHKTITGVGKKLLDLNQPSLGAFIVHLLQQVKQNDLDNAAATDFLIKSIAETFPEFRDTHTLILETNKPVYLFKRILFLLHSLHLRFSNHQDWGVPNTYTTLPMFVDNVLPTLCVWFHLFQTVSSSPPAGMQTLVDWVNSAHCNADLPRTKLETTQNIVNGPKLSVDQTYAVRAATLNLGQVIITRAKNLANEERALHWLANLNEVDLDGYLWSLAKDDIALRKVPRLIFPSIHF